MKSYRGPRRVLTACVAAAIALWGVHAATPAGGVRGVGSATPVTITAKLGASGKGTFTLRGGPTDSGRAVVSRKVAGGRLRTTQRLTGAFGTLVISTSQACARPTGTWKAVSGTRSYADARGGGRTRDRVGCKPPWKSATVVLTGTLTAPQIAAAPAYAQPALAFSTDMSDFGGVATEDSADLNEDGYVDVVIARHRWRTLDTFPMLVLLNDQRGGFVDGTSTIWEGSPPRLQWPRKTVIADFNNDGRPDIFVADHGYDGYPGPGFRNTLVLSTPSRRLRDATGQLPPRVRFSHSATAADVNGDGSLDLYIGSIYTDVHKEPPELMLNDGTGVFSACGACLPGIVKDKVYGAGMLQDGYTYTGSQFVDVDNDRDPDLVLAGQGFYRLPGEIVSSDSQVLVNDGTGHFSVRAGALPRRPWDNTATGLDVRAADLDADGFKDLAIAYTRTEPAYVGRWIQILINNGNGTFRDETSSRLPQSDNQGLWATQTSFNDLTGDGHLDLIVELYEGAKEPAPFYLNDGTGRFTPLPTGYGNTINNDFALVDARGDGHRDFFTSDDYAFPRIDHYLVREVDAPRRPGVPRGVRVTRDAASGRPVVAWPYVWGAARYEVWRSTAAGASGQRIATTRLMRFVDPTASSGTTYHYSIRAVNGSGASTLSAPASTTGG